MGLEWVEKYRNEHGFSLIPNNPKTKIPAFKKGEYKQYFDKVCHEEIKADYNVGVMLGKPSNNLIAFDDDTYAETFLDLFPEYREKTFCTKSGQKGGGILFRMMELPQACNFTKDGKTIQLFTGDRQIILPPSIHPETKRRYEILHDNPVYDLTKDEFRNIVNKLIANGFEIEKTKVTNAEGKSIRRKSTKELLESDWAVGERYDNFRDLALRRFTEGWIDEQVRQEAYSKNKTLTQCHSIEEVDRGIDSGFSIHQTNLANPQNGYFKKSEVTNSENIAMLNSKDKGESVPIGESIKFYTNTQWSDVAQEIQQLHHFVTLRETKDMWIYSEKDGVYIPDADTYIEEECQRLVRCCTSQSVNEIKNQIKRNKTMILSSDFFDSVIINTESGVIDPNTFEVLPHSSEYLTTTKLPFAVNMKANNFKLWKHITQSIIEPKDSKLFLEILWVLISWNNPHKKCIIFKGLSDTQKTTLMEIISWIIGSKNLATVKPQKFLVSGDRFSMSRFIGKRANFSEEINNLTPEMLENLKAMIGGMVQDAELKNSNDGREFDPKRFLFLFSTNFLDSIYQRIDDDSIINRFQFMMFKHVIKKKKGDWEKEFFKDEEDKKTSIETIIRLMLSWKKGGHVIQWDEAWRTKEILRAEQPIEDKYFESGRIIEKKGGRLILNEVRRDFESFCGVPIDSQALGYLMKNKGFESKHSGLDTYYQGYALSKVTKNDTL